MEKRSDCHFTYPPNIHELDLATMVSMYRARGEPRKAAPGKYIACCMTHNLLKEGKWWFGLYYSQKAWDSLLTRESGGYPMTEVEMIILGLIYVSADEHPHRDYVEKNCGILPKLAYLIVNDLKQFGFLTEDQQGFLSIQPRGERALQGICRRIFKRRFTPEMLPGFIRELHGGGASNDSDRGGQASLF